LLADEGGPRRQRAAGRLSAPLDRNPPDETDRGHRAPAMARDLVAHRLLAAPPMARANPTGIPSISSGRIAACWLLGLSATVALVATMLAAHPMGDTRATLITKESPHAMVSLQLAPSPEKATAILDCWGSTTASEKCGPASGGKGLEAARENLRLDAKLIVAYAAMLALLSLAVLGAVCSSWWLPGAVALAAIVAGACDWLENSFTSQILAQQDPKALAAVLPHLLGSQRVFAQAKFVLLLGVTLPIATAILALTRRWWLARPDKRPTKTRFAQLIAAETKGIVDASGRIPGEKATIVRGPAGEPWVATCQLDLVGIALSGGGIRSATFNLGFLAGLHKLEMLKRIDYLATVSGGGYVGSFWTAWLARERKRDPNAVEPPLWPWHELVEAGPVRHLREFSRFLAARRGFFEAETWEAVVAVFAGLVLSLLTALSLIGLGLIGWLATNFFLACPEPWAGIATVGVLTALAAGLYHRGWSAPSRMDKDDARIACRVKARVTVFAAMVGMAVEGLWAHHLPPPSTHLARKSVGRARADEELRELVAAHRNRPGKSGCVVLEPQALRSRAGLGRDGRIPTPSARAVRPACEEGNPRSRMGSRVRSRAHAAAR